MRVPLGEPRVQPRVPCRSPQAITPPPVLGQAYRLSPPRITPGFTRGPPPPAPPIPFPPPLPCTGPGPWSPVPVCHVRWWPTGSPPGSCSTPSCACAAVIGMVLPFSVHSAGQECVVFRQHSRIHPRDPRSFPAVATPIPPPPLRTKPRHARKAGRSKPWSVVSPLSGVLARCPCPVCPGYARAVMNRRSRSSPSSISAVARA